VAACLPGRTSRFLGAEGYDVANVRGRLALDRTHVATVAFID
jgi:hypothetical protein